MSLTKAELLGQFTNIQNNYVMGLAALSAFTSAEALAHLDKSEAKFGAYTVPFSQVATMMRHPDSRDDGCKEFLKMLQRALLKESFEVLKNYCHDTGQTELLVGQQWYQFARMVRNCVSHNFHFELTRYDKKLLPITWHGRTISEDLDGQPMPIALLGYDGTWELFKELEGFATTSLEANAPA